MKKLFFIPFCLCVISSVAQTEKAFTLASFQGVGGGWGVSPEVIPGGKKLVVGNSVIDPYKKQQTELPAVDIKYSESAQYSLTLYYSPNHDYRVVNYIDSKYAPVMDQRNKKKDWMSVGYCSTDTTWHYRAYEDDYAIGLTDEGQVLVTKPSNFNTKYVLKVEKMKGLWRYDPKTGIKTQITDDVLYDDDYFRASVHTTQDRKKVIILRQLKYKPLEIVVYDLATGNKHAFNVPGYYTVVSVGNDIVLMKDVTEVGTGREVTLVSLDDGHSLLSADQHFTAGKWADYSLPNCCILGNQFYFLHPTDFSVMKMELENGQMQIKSITKLDTSGLKLAAYSRDSSITYEFINGQSTRSATLLNGISRYHLAVLKDYYVIFPENVPESYRKPYPLFMYFMHPESGEALLAMKPFFAQPIERDYAAEAAKKAEDERAFQVRLAECERKAAASSPFPIGALVSKNGSGCSSPTFIWSGMICPSPQYMAYRLSGELRGYEVIQNPSQLHLCDVGPYTICSYCHGIGSFKKWDSISDDGWHQTNFNVYVRNPNAVRYAKTDHACEVCHGRGYYRQ